MAITLPNSIASQIKRPHGTNDAIWLLELELQAGTELLPPVLARLCDGAETITWPVGDPSPKTWHPFPFSFGPIEETQEGDMTQLELQIDNSTRFLMRWLHDGNGLEGRRATLYLTFRNGLPIVYPNHEFQRFKLVVLGAAAAGDAVSLRLGLPNWFQLQLPMDRYVPSKCRWDFAGPQCGYVLNSFAGFTSCPKTIAACIERGQDHYARGLPLVLPGNYGGHPGISRLRA
jgi:hypothetical protein